MARSGTLTCCLEALTLIAFSIREMGKKFAPPKVARRLRRRRGIELRHIPNFADDNGLTPGYLCDFSFRRRFRSLEPSSRFLEQTVFLVINS